MDAASLVRRKILDQREDRVAADVSLSPSIMRYSSNKVHPWTPKNNPMPTPTDCRKCGRPYYGAAGLLCDECERVALGPSDATPCSPRELAARIATRLFTNGLGDQGERLEIKQATGYEHERSLGGWCYLAALDQIETVILEENK